MPMKSQSQHLLMEARLSVPPVLGTSKLSVYSPLTPVLFPKHWGQGCPGPAPRGNTLPPAQRYTLLKRQLGTELYTHGVSLTCVHTRTPLQTCTTPHQVTQAASSHTKAHAEIVKYHTRSPS